MNLAESKKRNNVSEYIIHMYQTEDLIRVYQFDMQQIAEYVVKHIPAADNEKKELENWYAEIASKMKLEGIEETGHLNEVQAIVLELTEIKENLLKSDGEFIKIYEKAKPHIDQSIELSQGKVKSDIQACLNGIYGLLLLRMNGKKVPENLMESINEFGNVLSYLSYKYKQINFLNDN